MSQADVSVKLERRVFEALVSFGADEDMISRDASLEDLDVDSLDLVELGQIIEDEYGLRLTPEDFTDVETVGQAIDTIQTRLEP